MPMSWDAAADAKLFTVVMAVYDIKISGAQNERIARLMGEDVTPKAITHRLSKIKAQAASFTPITPGSRKRPATNDPKTPSTSTKASGKGSAKSAKGLSATHTITTIMHDNNSDDEEDFSSFTPTHIAKKRKFGSKGPKIEVGDEKGKFPGMDDDAVEGEGDAIDFSLQHKYTDAVTNLVIKAEESSKQVVDLTADATDADAGAENMAISRASKGKGKQKETREVKKKMRMLMMRWSSKLSTFISSHQQHMPLVDRKFLHPSISIKKSQMAQSQDNKYPLKLYNKINNKGKQKDSQQHLTTPSTPIKHQAK
ncbi:unnamed protein product, partial [Aureobasidium uvarum]